jgi:hypothetical protein
MDPPLCCLLKKCSEIKIQQEKKTAKKFTKDVRTFSCPFTMQRELWLYYHTKKPPKHQRGMFTQGMANYQAPKTVMTRQLQLTAMLCVQEICFLSTYKCNYVWLLISTKVC